MIEPRMKYITLGLVLIVSILAHPGDRIPNHPNCPEHEGPRPVYFVHPTNCSRFYECKQKDAWEFECARGLHFNSKIDVCDYPANAQCEPQSSGTTTNPPTTSLVTSTTTTPNTTPTTPETVPTNPPTTPTSAPPPTVVTTTTTTPYPTPDLPSTPTSYTTPDDSTTTPNPTPNTPTTATPDDSTTTPNPASDATTTYRPPQSEVTPMPNCPPFGATQPNYWADHSDCSRYLGCLENCVQNFQCPGGLYWNDVQKQCDIYGNSPCCPVIPPAPNVWPATTTTSIYPNFRG
ncbi:mucin-2-like [Anopheles moucheti]|uniref:mucin-2-like n=1 Tax=Anopheles moucheti TaxID=186751 RepID=UPI0022F0B949|nr:mucin-2-like [Anopheles moucheti]